MDQVMAWAGFLGAWLLVAGPLYQGALELLEEDVDREGMQASIADLPRLSRVRRPARQGEADPGRRLADILCARCRNGAVAFVVMVGGRTSDGPDRGR
jgi:hypothetical protein